MTHDSADLSKITSTTLDHYERSAAQFWEGTRDHDVSQNIAALLAHISTEPPFSILDFGCGPGRDLKQFKDLGHIAIGRDGAANFAEVARASSRRLLRQRGQSQPSKRTQK